jgi:hypothetical protein
MRPNWRMRSVFHFYNNQVGKESQDNLKISFLFLENVEMVGFFRESVILVQASLPMLLSRNAY